MSTNYDELFDKWFDERYPNIQDYKKYAPTLYRTYKEFAIAGYKYGVEVSNKYLKEQLGIQ